MKARARARAAQPLERRPSSRVTSALDRAFGVPKGDGYEDEAHGFVHNTDEVARILALPRSDWKARSDLGELVDLLSDAYRAPAGTMRLREVQAVLLETLHDVGGVVGFVGVGKGKTLATYLAPLVVDAARPLLLVPAKLRDKTRRDFAALAAHWRSGAEIRIESYEKLGRVSGAAMLEDYAPDLVICDEVQALSNPRAARSRRFVRYCREHAPALMLLSGTLASRSLLDFHHFLALALGPERSPLPAPREEARTWARAVDEKVQGRARPGALRFFLEPKASPSLANIRAAVGDRIQATRGVVATTLESVEVPISIDVFEPPLSPALEHHLTNLTKHRTAPSGEEAAPSDVYRHTRTLVCGFFYRWNPAPPRPWAIARSAWKSFVWEVLDQEDPRFDSELQVANGVRRGELEDGGALERWQEIRDTFKPNSVPVWLSDAPLSHAMKRDTGRSLVWVEHRAVGARLSERFGLPYYGRLGLDAEGRSIEDHKDGSAILSIAANAEGRNLQRFSHNLVISPPASGRTWEQLIGRTHRPGQDADEVAFDVMLGAGVASQFRQAFADARFIEATTGQPQKLLSADLIREI